jgi:glycosyltransferase involved in cell wall biosynthesis
MYLVGTDPRNISYGGEQRSHFIWKGLKKFADVYTVIPVAHKSQERADEIDKIRWICFDRRWTVGWLVRRIWQRFFPRIGLPSRCGLEQVKTLYPFQIDGCVVRYVAMASFFRAWKIAPMFLDVDDLLTEAFDSLHKEKLSFCYKIYRELMHKYETVIFSHAQHLWVANPAHCQTLKQYSVSYLPNIPCALASSCWDSLGTSFELLFVGSLNCDQNYWGLDYFLSHYWAVLIKKYPQLTFRIAGGGLPEQYKAKWSKYSGVKLLGFVEDLLPLYEHCMCVIAPLYVGSGSAIKVLESLYSGRVCVATPYAVRGLQPEDCCTENGIVVFHCESELVQAIEQMLNVERRKEMQHGAYRLMVARFSQQKVNEAISMAILKR